MERPREDQEHPGNLVGIMELDPLFQFFSEAGWGDPDRSDPTRETGVLEFFGGEGLDAFGVNHLRIAGTRIIMWFHHQPHTIVLVDGTTCLSGVTHHIIHPNLFQPSPNLMLQEIIRPKRVDIHIPTHRDQLRSRQVVQCDITLEKLGDLDDVFRASFLPCGSDFTEEFFEFVAVDDLFSSEA